MLKCRCLFVNLIFYKEEVMRFFALLTIVVLLFGVIAVDAQDGKTNFTGKWTLNADKSNQGGGGRGMRGFGATKMVIEQKDNKLIVESFSKNRDGDEVSSKAAYTLDGKKSKNETNRGASVSIAKWSKDGKVLTINSERTFGRGDRTFTMESTEKWSLKNNTLTIESTMSTPRGDRESKRVYDKAK